MFPHTYPAQAPLVYLDEAESPEIIEMVDYLDSGNKIMFDYLINWERNYSENPSLAANNYSLRLLLVKIYKLFVAMPPVSMSELFGSAEAQNSNDA